MPRTIKKLPSDTPLQSSNPSPFLSSRQKQPQIYRLQKNTPILKKQNQMNVRIIKIQILVILISLIIYASIFGIKCLIHNSTEAHEAVENCVEGERSFDGWNFVISCTHCVEGYHVDEITNSCLVGNQTVINENSNHKKPSH